MNTLLPTWLEELGVQSGESFSLNGFTNVSRDDIYQFQLAITGNAQLFLNGELLHSVSGTTQEREYVPVALKAGWHKLSLRGTFAKKPRLHLSFGSEGTYTVGKRDFWH